jgi:hypothetical protein
VKFPATIVAHDQKSETDEGYKILKVTARAECNVHGSTVEMDCKFAVPAESIEDYPIGHSLEVEFGDATK